jgi:hypothetical protein
MQGMPDDVRTAFEAFGPDVRGRLMDIRALIFDRAGDDPAIGAITETLKWGEPAYLTEQSGSGSTIRLGCPRGRSDSVALYFNCRTTLVGDFRMAFGDMFEFEGSRAVFLPIAGPLPREPLVQMLGLAMTYHLRRRRQSGSGRN